MSQPMQPFNFLAGTATLGYADTPGWDLDQLPAAGGPDRVAQATVRFVRPFRNAPLVHVGITGLDISNEDAARLTVTAANVTARGFDIVASTWFNTRLWRTQVSWLAIGA